MTLEQEFRQILARMALLQYGRTQAFDASGGKSENPDPRPSGAQPEHFEYGFGKALTLAEHWAWRWERSPTEVTLTAARAALGAWVKRQAPAEGDGSDFEQWIIDDGKGYAVEQVASKFGIAPQRVVRLRLKHDRDAEFGMPTTVTTRAERKDGSRQRVLTLAGQGMTVRQIKTITDVPRETVRRWIKETAA